MYKYQVDIKNEKDTLLRSHFCKTLEQAQEKVVQAFREFRNVKTTTTELNPPLSEDKLYKALKV